MMLGKTASLFADMSVECRHGVYVWWLTLACLTGIMIIALFRVGGVAEHAVEALSGVLTTVVTAYLGVELLGRSGLPQAIAGRIASGPQSSTPASNGASNAS